jgi:ankyrin repeat protein
MSAPKALPERPSIESLQKQAKQLARDITAHNTTALARARAQLPNVDPPLSRRDAQLVLAREYGYAGWQDLTAEVARRAGHGLAWAVSRAEHLIHDNDTQGLRQLLADYPALLTWGPERGGVLGMATGSYGDSFQDWQEKAFTRRDCAELLIDAGAVVVPMVAEGILRARARELMQLFHRRGLLPRTLPFLAALGDLDGVRGCFDGQGRLRPGAAGPGSTDERAAVNEGFLYACRYHHESVAAFLLDRCIAIEPALRRNIDAWRGRAAFIDYVIANGLNANASDSEPLDLWRAFVLQRVSRAVHEGETQELVALFREYAWLGGEAFVPFQSRLFEVAVMNDHPEVIDQLLELDLALFQRRPAPPARAIVFALEYAKARLIPRLLRIWPPQDTLPYAAGTGELAAVQRWFDASGAPALGNPAHHLGRPSPDAVAEHEMRPPTVQRVLDTALAYACLNNHLEIADFLLAHGADINTRWCSHEPASILHELVWYKNYEAMQFLVDRGIDMTIIDYRWNSTAQGWARHAARDEELARWLAEAEEHQGRGAS